MRFVGSKANVIVVVMTAVFQSVGREYPPKGILRPLFRHQRREEELRVGVERRMTAPQKVSGNTISSIDISTGIYTVCPK
jgi:hypothetical protein